MHQEVQSQLEYNQLGQHFPLQGEVCRKQSEDIQQLRAEVCTLFADRNSEKEAFEKLKGDWTTYRGLVEAPEYDRKQHAGTQVDDI